jgi:DNA invertase Pin-like site-specific DNA recombinase
MSIDATARIPTNPRRVVREIPALMSQNALSSIGDGQEELLAAYGRVSSETEEQQESYEAQMEYYTAKFSNKAGINFVGFFGDEGISGKHAHNREDFQRMLKLCYDGRVTRIVTKSVSRFARNQVECMKLARDLKNRGITIFFETQGIDTKDEGSFVILSVLASMAEEEIRTLSRNVIFGYLKRYKAGQVNWTGRMLGYEVVKGVFQMIPDEAIIVREIFDLFLKGKSYYQICHILMQKEIKTVQGKDKWRRGMIEMILSNEKYYGDVILQKTYAPDIMLPRRKNDGKRPKFEVQNNHIGIISKTTFDTAQAEIARRTKEAIMLKEKNSKYCSLYPFSGKVICTCNGKFRRFAQTFIKKGVKQTERVWVCTTHQNDRTTCGVKPIKESALERAFVATLNNLINNQEMLSDMLGTKIEEVLAGKVIDSRLLAEQLVEAQDELIRISREVPEGGQARAELLIEKIQSLQCEIELAQIDSATQDLTLMRLAEMKKLIKRPLEFFNVDIFTSLIDKVLITSENDKPSKLHFVFYCGIETIEPVPA